MRGLFLKLPPTLRTQEAGLAFFLLLCVPLLLWRSSLVELFWIDEMYTVTLVHHTLAKSLELTTFDAHPPGYYWFLKLWLKPFRLLGFEPGLVLTRMPGILAWVAMGLAAFRGAERLLGRPYALPAAVALCLSANCVHMGTEARQYSIVIPAMFLCWLIVMLAHYEPEAGERRSRRLWTCYAALAGLSLWFQLLTAPMVAVLGTQWLLLATRRGDWKSAFFRHGLWAHIAILLIVSPWLGNLRHNIHHLHFMPRPWQTPATPLNFATVFFYWIPLGPVPFGMPPAPPPPADGIWYAWNLLLLPALASVLVPLRVLVQARLRPRGTADSRLLAVGASGLGTTAAFTFLIWWFDRWGVARTFHGLRYPMVGMGPWVFGLIALAAWSAARLGWRPGRVWAIAAPWLFCCVLGQVLVLAFVHRPSLPWACRQYPPLMPPKGETVYVMPTEFIPYVAGAFRGYTLRPIEEIAEVAETTGTVHVFNVSPLVPSYKPRDTVLFALLQGGRFASDQGGFAVPREYPILRYFRLRGFNHDLARRMRNEPVAALNRDIPRWHVALAVPEEQSMLQGWSLPELASDMTVYRWGGAPRVRLRFDRRVPPGRYRLHLVGYHSPYPTDPARIRLQFQGEPEAREILQPSGGFHFVDSFNFTHEHNPPVLLIDRATWVPREFERQKGILDPRALSVMLNHAWLEEEM